MRNQADPRCCDFADLILDTGTRQASRGDRVISLTAKEYELLELFLRHPRQVLTRDMIFDRVWGYDFGGESNIIEVYIRYLRQKLEMSRRTTPPPYCTRYGVRFARTIVNKISCPCEAGLPYYIPP